MTSAAPARDDIEATKDLVLAFWASMDATNEVSGESHFAESGILTIDPGSSPIVEVRGHAALAEFCRQRSEGARSSKRITRHVVSNLRVVGSREGGITLNGYVTDYVGAGDPPLPLQCPTAVADFDYELVRTDGHPWRLFHVRGKVIFAGPK